MAMAEGVDYSWSRPNLTDLTASGKVFVVRYGGPGSPGKLLSLDEARALGDAGLSIVANAEDQRVSSTLAGGLVIGMAWAASADLHFRKCGMPADRPIYLSVDFDVTAAQWPAVADALRGAASVIGAERVGVYGSYQAVTWARRDRVAAWFWQTYAWSGGQWARGNHIEQYRNGVPLGGGDVDLNRALTVDYGQWTTGGGSVWQKGQPWRTVDSIDGALFPQLKAAAPRAVPPATPVTSWGTIADGAHDAASDHYPHFYVVLGSMAVVCACDWPHAPALGLDNHVVCEAMRRSRDPRIKYLIFDGRMFSSYPTSTRKAWEWGPYSSTTDMHREHAHLSVVAAAVADVTAPWSIGVDDVTPEEYAEIVKGNLTPNNVMHYRLRSIQDAADPALQPYYDKGWTKSVGIKQLAAKVDELSTTVDDIATTVATLAAGGVSHEALVAALSDPSVAAALATAAFEGAQRAERE
jgi:hypothetical protein